MTGVKADLAGFTLIEVMVAMLLIAFCAITSMSMLQMTAKKSTSANQYIRMVTISQTAKDKFHDYMAEALIAQSAIPAQLSCNATSLLDSKAQLENYLCALEQDLDRSGTRKIYLNTDKTITPGGLCNYDLTLKVNDPNGVIFQRAWLDQELC